MKRLLFLIAIVWAASSSSVFAQFDTTVRPRVVIDLSTYSKAKAELSKLNSKLDKHRKVSNKCASSYEELKVLVDSWSRSNPRLDAKMIDVRSDCLAVETPNFKDAKQMTEHIGKFLMFDEQKALNSGWTSSQLEDYTKEFFKLWDKFKVIEKRRPDSEAIDDLLLLASKLQ